MKFKHPEVQPIDTNTNVQPETKYISTYIRTEDMFYVTPPSEEKWFQAFFEAESKIDI